MVGSRYRIMHEPTTPKLQLTDRILARTVLPMIPTWVRPNWLTTLRFLAVPVVVTYVIREQFGGAILIFVLAAFTDLLDGALARTRNQITNIGKVLDPIADKLLIGSLMVTMVVVYLSPPLAVIIIGLEIIFLVGGFYRLSRGVIPQANLWGKIKFNFQVLGVLFLFASVFAVDPTSWQTAATVTFTIGIIFAILSLATHGF